MALVSLVRVAVGEVGVKPGEVKMVSTDNLATITAANYIKNSTNSPAQIIGLSPSDEITCLYSYNAMTNSGSLVTLQASLSNGVYTLAAVLTPGDVTLPVVSGDFANFDGTTGKIKDGGFSPTDAAKTKVIMLNTAPVTIGRVATFSATTGTVQDSGTLLSALQLSANIKAARTANIGGAGAGPISVAVTGLTAASVVTASIQASSNAVTVQKVTATSSGFDILFSGDPGATCTVNYVAFVAAQ